MARRHTLEGRAAGKRRSSQHQPPRDSAVGEAGRGDGEQSVRQWAGSARPVHPCGGTARV